MNTWEVLRRPVVTEKTTILSESRKYAFEVHKKATKPQIKRAVEAAFDVKVTGVNTSRAGPCWGRRAGLSLRQRK